ncbi:MAG: dihydropyrimidinase [Anaerolineae bacterium]|jgi:dihydropyrimidinase|nr:dihydropyrimidinase [Anaerolineae bacterium]MBT3713399.1 dihydropyrimidinase [Anaerolineae bacterium]MBT4312660.1 dihydropyrimidinase [Anaerolineae bacterium]MBT4459403.1 dihydropyrimidinase [Anaerolineae bacterium]MBT6061069.1 dihydropyrimidinase [Anaerolineae bacterium]
MSTLIQNGTIITASETFKADILIEDSGRISAIGRDLHAPKAERIDATGKLLLPGGVDPHTHFDLPMFGTVSSDDHYTGHKAAAFGGTTTVIDFINQDFDSLKQCVDAWHKKADDKAAIDYSFHMNIVNFNEKIAKEIPSLLDEGITTLKIFTAYNGVLRIGDNSIFKVLRTAAENGMLTLLHAENGDVIETLVDDALKAGNTSTEWHALTRPSWGAGDAILRVAGMAQAADASLYIVHMNTAIGADMLKYSREQGVKIMGETCPQYLFFTIDNMRQPDGAKWVCSPPMRNKTDNARLWQAVERGEMQTIGTDHCPFFFDGTQPILYEGQEIAISGKELGVEDFTKTPNGLPAVGDRLPVMWTEGVVKGRITPNQFVAMNSTNPAKIFGMYPRKGALLPGSDADIVIWDPERKVTHGVAMSHQRTDYNLFEGWELTGYPEKVFLRGELIVDGDEWLGKRGEGEFIKRKEGEIL